MPLVTLVSPGYHILWNLPEDISLSLLLFEAVAGAGRSKDCALSGRGWPGLRLRSLREGLAGAKTALSRAGAGRGKDL